MSESSRATVEVIKARKPMSQGSVPLPGSGDSVVYKGARRRLSVVDTCNGEPGLTTSLRVEVITDEMVTTAGRPNYRIAIDIPLDEALLPILSAALDRAEEVAQQHMEPLPEDFIEEAILDEYEEGSEGEGVFEDPTVQAVLDHADQESERRQVEGLEEAAFGTITKSEVIEADERRQEAGAEIRPTNDHEDVTN